MEVEWKEVDVLHCLLESLWINVFALVVQVC